MAESKRIILEIDVNDKDVQSLNSELERTQKNFKDTQREADKTSSSLKDVGDNGGAIAILDEFTGGLATKMRDAAEASKLFSGSLKGVRTALLATGIGAIVVSVGLLVAYWEDIADWIERVDKGLEVQLETTRKIKDTTNAELELLNKKIENAELQGKANEELQKQRNKLLEDLQTQNKAEVKILENQLARLKAAQAEVSVWDYITDGIVQATLGQEALAKKQAERFAGNIQDIKDLEAAIAQAKLEGIDLEMVLFNIRNPQGDGGFTPQVQGVNSLTPQGIIELEAYKNLETQKTSILRAEADARMAIERMVTEAKISSFRDGLGAIMGFMDQNSKAYKGFAIAQALINTYESANAAYKSAAASPITTFFPAYPIVQAGIAVTKGLAQVAAIKSTKVGSMGNVSGGGGGASGGGSIPAPSFNVVGNTGVNQLANVVGEQFNKPVKAYITTGDVSSAQQLENDTVSNASLG